MLKFIHALTFLLFISSAFGQKINLQEALTKSSIDSQFYYLNILSRSQDADFKIIRKTNLERVRQNTRDTLKTLRTEIQNLKQSSSSSVSANQQLTDSVQNLQTRLDAEKLKTDSISFFGIDFSKSGYHTLVWILIIVLAVALIATLFAFRTAKVDTVASKRNAEEFQEELHAYKKKALEKEQQLKRQLLDEQLKRNS
ncbi:hypothetical protein FAZ15_04660 [Sphingobacterium olei]|uniref:tRNA (Guanine-N1)-methyltransferase n=1 Tax=Sphingobacterium olei TaxID=2571155 RepID=A0A4U0PGC1_9SPHI|nr:hypothetical protein [Sphingobacterium olei]TJZ61814.1 hypothetical protein FAZ15_04660 [Sphingobacterium olei]